MRNAIFLYLVFCAAIACNEKKEAEKKIAEDIKAAAKATYAENSEELEKAAAALQEDTPDTEEHKSYSCEKKKHVKT